MVGSLDNGDVCVWSGSVVWWTDDFDTYGHRHTRTATTYIPTPPIQQARDECIVMNGEDNCAALIEAHKVGPCLFVWMCLYVCAVGVGGWFPLVMCAEAYATYAHARTYIHINTRTNTTAMPTGGGLQGLTWTGSTARVVLRACVIYFVGGMRCIFLGCMCVCAMRGEGGEVHENLSVWKITLDRQNTEKSQERKKGGKPKWKASFIVVAASGCFGSFYVLLRLVFIRLPPTLFRTKNLKTIEEKNV